MSVLYGVCSCAAICTAMCIMDMHIARCGAAVCTLQSANNCLEYFVLTNFMVRIFAFFCPASWYVEIYKKVYFLEKIWNTLVFLLR